ncbi:MAG: lysophospholipid acyltransferase family protein [Acidobacteria bacterium]|nr:lysophospholipid acyltransferase family protein [Acidobacteriota bacterium]MYJ02821.1 lysophospholipid acyltransferase family protein [Acidobacteriota bacterium]
MTEGPARHDDTPRRLSFRQRTMARLIGALGAPVVDAICRTLRWRVEGMEHHDAIVASGRQPVLAFWHGRVLHATWFWRGRGIVVMISENFDGEWIGRLIEWFGYRTARGSSSRGGARAMVRMRRLSVDGAPTGFAVDGPRGPARSVQPGAVWLASLTGQPILPFHAESDRYWTIRSWDGTQVPKPFARTAMVIGPPIYVPRRPDDDVMEEKRRELADSLAALAERATVMARAPARETN